MMRRMARTAAITVFNLKSSAKRKVSVPRKRSETCGNFFCGCTRAKTRKKFPSSAAEYGTREYPSNEENTEADYRNEDAARNIARGIADFASEMANVVVTPVGVDGVDGGGAEGSKKQPGKIPRSRRIGEHEARLEVRSAAPDEPQDRTHNADPEKKRDFSDGSNAAIEQDHEQNYERAGDRFLPVFSKRVEVGSVLREADGAGSKAQGSLNQRLPDEQEGHQTAQATGAVGFAKENVATAGQRHGRAQF